MAARWLLDWTIGGRVYRWATDAVTVTDDAGAEYAYRPGLELASLSRSATSTAIDIVDATDWPALVASGTQLERGQMLLRYHRDGDTLERADMWLRGIGVGAEYGDDLEPLSITLDASPRTMARDCPPTSTQVNRQTWPTARAGGYVLPDQSQGSYPPLVFGYPGQIDSGTTAVAYRIYPVEQGVGVNDRAVVAYGKIAAANLNVYAVKQSEQATAFTDLMAVGTMTDALGQTVSYVYPGSGTPWNATGTPLQGFNPDAEIWVLHTSTNGGGIEVGGAVVRGLADVARYLLEQYSDIEIDNGQWETWAPYLNAVKLDTVITEPINAWEYVQRALLPLTEAVPRWTADGLYLLPLRWDATASDVVGTIEIGRNAERLGRARNRDPIRNRFEIRYALGQRGFWSTSVVAAEPGKTTRQTWAIPDADPRVLSSYVVARSAAVWGEVSDDPIETACLWSDASALRVLQLRALRYAWPKRTVQVQGGEDLEYLTAGDVVAYTDAGMSISGVLAIVEDVSRDLLSTRLSLTLLDGPSR